MAPGVSSAVPRSDTQFWTEADLTVRVTASASMTCLGVIRDGSGLPNPALAGGGGTLDINDGPWTFTAGNLWVVVRSPASGHRTAVDLPLGAVSYEWSFAGVSFSDRNRAENLIGIPGDPWRYRNRVLIDYPVTSLGPIKTLFASDEVFFDFGHDQWSRNRAQFGVVLPVQPNIQMQIYYMRQDDRFSHPGALNILGVTLKGAFL